MRGSGFIIAGILFCALLSGCRDSESDGVPVVGLDDQGKLISKFMDPEMLEDELAKSLERVERTTLEALADQSAESKWNLKAIVVGIGVNIEVGLRHILTLGQGGRWRLVFTKTDDFALPNSASEVQP